MRRTALLAILLSFSLLSGCAVSETLFNVFGDYYSAGGTTREEKKYHYDRQIEKWNNLEQYGAPQ